MPLWQGGTARLVESGHLDAAQPGPGRDRRPAAPASSNWASRRTRLTRMMGGFTRFRTSAWSASTARSCGDVQRAPRACSLPPPAITRGRRLRPCSASGRTRSIIQRVDPRRPARPRARRDARCSTCCGAARPCCAHGRGDRQHGGKCSRSAGRAAGSCGSDSRALWAELLHPRRRRLGRVFSLHAARGRHRADEDVPACRRWR